GGWSADTWLASLKVPRYGLESGTSLAVKRYKHSVFEMAPNVPERIEREGRLGASLAHQNLVQILDLYQGNGDNGERDWALIMELWPGGDLSSHIKKQWPLSGGSTLSIAAGLAAGLAAMHDGNMIHRDIKPDNILIAADGSPKIGDFGVIDRVDEVTLT